MTPVLVSAQGGRGGFGGGGGGRGQRGQPSRSDSTAVGAPRAQLSFVDIVFAHRADLQLSDSQTIKLSDIRMTSTSRRALLTRELDSVKAAMMVSPEDGAMLPTDSSRHAIMERRRALAAVLGDLHDVDVNARNETLFVLNPDQQKKAEQLEGAAGSAAATNAHGRRGDGRRGGGRPGGGGGIGGP